ncbi:MAG: methyltransferase domain-containing protein [Chloroflexi bacterium]|nr:methyltransferase domain-containing protein [Chloroflexota bacterium]
MATVFMKWLETSPKDYDRGIQILTLGRLGRLKEKIVREYVRAGARVLEIGCGTGVLAARMARQGAVVAGIDASPAMLAEARRRIAAEGLGDHVTLRHMDATRIEDEFPPASFDLIVSTLVFSELPPDEQRYVLDACAGLLAPGGRLLIADEVIPARWLPRLLFYLVRWPLAILTWLLTRTSTAALRDFDSLLARSGFRARLVASYLGGSLVLYEILPADAAQPEAELPAPVVGRLRHRVTLRTLLLDLWMLFFRIIPPYPKVRPGLYAVGHPGPDSPLLVTGNFDLTVRRLVRGIDGRADVWLLVADSAGINVWCAAGGGYFTAEKVISAVRSSRVEEVVSHHALILPQLCANGVDGWRIRREIGWGVHWGPVRAEDVPAYLAAGRKKTDDMRWVRFPVRDRLEMVTVTLGFYGLLILLPVLLFWRGMFWPITASLVGLSYFYAIVHPWLPGRDGLLKSIPLTLIALAGLLTYTVIWDPLPATRLFNWTVGLTGLSVFTAAELQGMSPLMRGEQANWGWEAIIGVMLGLIYWLVPLALGWR